MRRSGWLLILVLLPLQVSALSLGDLVVRSLPGEPLRAHIPFTLLPGETLTEVRVTLATAEQYQARGLPRVELLQKLAIALVEQGEGRGRVQLFAEQPWQGEEVRLLLFVSWQEGVMERRYRLEPVAPAQAEKPVFVEVARDETLDEIAVRLSRGRNRSYLHMMYALFLVNPDAFYRGNMNNLKSGQSLRVPSNEELYALSDREVFDGIRQQYEQWQQLRESAQQRGTQAGEALAGMSEEQAAGLDLSGDDVELQRRLQQVAAEGEAIRQENAQLRERLRALEQRMESVADQVLEYADEEVLPPVAAVAPTGEEKPAQQPAMQQEETLQKETLQEETLQEDGQEADGRDPEGGSDKEAEGTRGLSGTAFLVAIVLVLLAVYYIGRSGGRPARESP